MVLQPLPIQNGTSSIPQGFYDCIIPGLMRTSTPPSSLSTERILPICASQKCQPENVNQKNQDLPISDIIIKTSRLWRAKIGEIAVRSQAEENWDGKNRERRLRRLGCIVFGLVVVTVVMFVL